jgi:hypothetical protein
VVDEGIRLFLEREAQRRGRPDVQTPRRPDDRSDQNPIPDQKLIIRSSDQLIDGENLDARTPSSIWEEAKKSVSSQLSPENIDTWFSPVQIDEVDKTNQLIRLRAPNLVVRDWIESNYSNLLCQAFAEIGYPGYRIEWRMAKEESTAVIDSTRAAPPTSSELKRELLDFYAVICENRLTPEDDTAFLKVSECSPEAIKAGILRSRLSTMKRGERVGRFSYCVKAIWQIHNAGLARRELMSLQEEYYERRPQQASLIGQVRDIK